MDESFYCGLNRSDAKSLALYRAIRQKLESSPDPDLLIQNALKWVQKFAPSMPEVPYLNEWKQRLQAAIQSEDARRDLVNNPALKDGACIRTPPQLRVSRETRGFGFTVRCFRDG